MSDKFQAPNFGGTPLKAILNPKLSYDTILEINKEVHPNIVGASDPDELNQYHRYDAKAIVKMIDDDVLDIDDEDDIKTLNGIAELYDYIEFY